MSKLMEIDANHCQNFPNVQQSSQVALWQVLELDMESGRESGREAAAAIVGQVIVVTDSGCHIQQLARCDVGTVADLAVADAAVF